MDNQFGVTAIGLATGAGVGWQAVLSSNPGIHFSKVLKNLNEKASFLDEKYLRRLDRSNLLALVAINDLFKNAHLKNYPPEEVGLLVVNSSCGIQFLQQESKNLSLKGPEHVSRYLSVAFFSCGSAGMISLIFNIKGYSTTLNFVSNPLLEILNVAADILVLRKAQYVIVGATESPLVPLIEKNYVNPKEGILAEASCFFLIESLQSAKIRRQMVLATLEELKMQSYDMLSGLRKKWFGNCLTVNPFLEMILAIHAKHPAVHSFEEVKNAVFK